MPPIPILGRVSVSEKRTADLGWRLHSRRDATVGERSGRLAEIPTPQWRTGTPTTQAQIRPGRRNLEGVKFDPLACGRPLLFEAESVFSHPVVVPDL